MNEPKQIQMPADRTLLIVDDDAPLRNRLVRAMEKRGFIVANAGTVAEGEHIVTSGGRVLAVTALGDNVRLAQRRAYEAAAQIRFDGMQMRRDIGHRAVGSSRRGK